MNRKKKSKETTFFSKSDDKSKSTINTTHMLKTTKTVY